jgi:hypothetical protein
MPHWLSKVDIPLFISHRRLKNYKTLPLAQSEWCLDSGGFSELSMFGEWRTTPNEYVTAIRRYVDEIGHLNWCAPQDAMCEPWILDKSRAWLGGTVEAHQIWTVRNYLQLKELAPELPFIPVLQGWHHDDYHRHVGMYDKAGVDLTQLEIVGLGSVCRRQATDDIGRLVATLHGIGLKLHGFGVKSAGLAQYGNFLASADSMAWSFGGRQIRPCKMSQSVHCGNCLHYALDWREKVLQAHQRPQSSMVQLQLEACA